MGEKEARVSKGQALAFLGATDLVYIAFLSRPEDCLSQPVVHGREMCHLLLASGGCQKPEQMIVEERHNISDAHLGCTGPKQSFSGPPQSISGPFPTVVSNLCINYITLMDELSEVGASTEQWGLQLEPSTLVNTLKV